MIHVDLLLSPKRSPVIVRAWVGDFVNFLCFLKRDLPPVLIRREDDACSTAFALTHLGAFVFCAVILFFKPFGRLKRQPRSCASNVGRSQDVIAPPAERNFAKASALRRRRRDFSLVSWKVSMLML